MLLASMLGACQAIAGIEEIKLSDNAGLCRQYCSEVTTKCTGDYSLYHDNAQCLAVCKNMPQGKATDKKGNTVGCRLNLAQAISSAERSACAQAGPGGAGVCGDNCEGYCVLMSKACDAYPDYWLSNVEACKTACRALHDLGTDAEPPEILYSAKDEQSRDHDGDTVQCRLFHVAASSPSEATATAHCWHAALSPLADADNATRNPCQGWRDGSQRQVAPRCEDYCRTAMVACTEKHAIYEDEEQCLASCKNDAFAPGTLEDDRPPDGPTNQDTLGCRYSHAYKALTAEDDATLAMECAAASPSGEEFCGSRCEGYCRQVEKTCPDVYKSDCTTKCQNEVRDRKVLFSLENAVPGVAPLVCRLHALTEARAAKSEAEKKAKCAMAVGAGEPKCD